MGVRKFTSRYKKLTLVVIAFLGGVILSAYVQRELLLLRRPSRVEISDGSVHALYNFDDNAKDTAGHAYNGSINASFTAGKFGQGAQFDGNSEYITLPHGATVWGDSDWSMSVWVKFAASINGQTIIADDDGGGSHPKWILSYGDELPGHLTLTEDWGGRYVDLGPYTPDTTSFHNFVLTYDRTSRLYNLYDNGTEIADVVGGSQSSPTSDITLGRAETNFYLNGIEDDLALFTKVLPTSTIRSIYNSGNGAEICTTIGCAT